MPGGNTMFGLATRALITRALVFASTLTISMAIVGSLPKFKARRQQYFSEAATDGNLQRMQWLHLAGVNVDARGGCPPLCLAARAGRLNAVRYLLDHGADLNARDAAGNTALAEATYYGQVPVMKELLSRGANINTLSSTGTPLDIALSRSNDLVADLLRHYGAKRASELQ
jgi:ankyrin repeat protein